MPANRVGCPISPLPATRDGPLPELRRRRQNGFIPPPSSAIARRKAFWAFCTTRESVSRATTPKPHIGYVLQLSKAIRMLRLISPRSMNLAKASLWIMPPLTSGTPAFAAAGQKSGAEQLKSLKHRLTQSNSTVSPPFSLHPALGLHRRLRCS